MEPGMELTSALRLRLDPAAPDVVAFTGGGGKTSSVRRLAAEIAARGGRVICTTTTRLAAYEVEGDPATVEVSAAGLPLSQIADALALYHRCVLVRPEIVDGVERKYPGLSPAQVDDMAEHAGAWGVGAILIEADGSRRLPAKAPADYEPPVPASTTLLVPAIGLDAVGRLIVEGQLHRPQQMRQVLGLDVIARLRLSPAMAARLLVHEQGGGKHRPPGADLVALLNKAESAPARACARLAARAFAVAGHVALIASTGLPQAPPVYERWGPLTAVILAAGEGRRMGRAKQLVEADGEPLVVRALRLALAADVDETLVVTGAHADEVGQALQPWLTQAGSRVRLVHNPAWASGQASSMHAALGALSPATQAVLFLPVDQPWLPVSLLRRLARLWRAGWAMAAPSVDGEVRGAPALFDRALWPELLAVRGDRGGRGLLRTYAPRVGSVAVDGSLLADIDTRQDMASLSPGG